MGICEILKQQSGSAVTVLMGGVAVLAMLSFGVYQLVSGPLTSMSRVTQKNQVNNHLAGIAAIAAIDATNIGDCDDDGFIEPREFRTTSGGAPTNGGLVPTDMGIDVKDPWNMDYGYCVWDLGPQYDQATCGGTGANRLDGADDSVTGEPQTLTVFAIISAGMNRSFETTCNDYSDTTTDVITAGGDDIVYRYTYNEAATATSSLWALKTGDADTAQINKNLEIGDDITFDQTTGAINALALNASDQVQSLGGIKLGDESTVTSCTAMTAGTLRYNSGLVKIQYCDVGGSWVITDDINWPVEAPDGTSGAPSYSFTNSTTSGVYQQGGSVEMVSPTGTTASIKGGSSLISVNDTTVSLASNGSLDMQAPNSGEIDFSNGGTDFRLKSNGGLQIANTTGTCDANSQGTIRYAFSSVYFEYCDGSDWVELSKDPASGPWKIAQIAVAAEHSCAISGDNIAYCWGHGFEGRIGDGTTTYVDGNTQDVPTAVDSSDTWLMVSSGGDNTGTTSTCGIKTDGSGWCWGKNNNAALGIGVGYSTTPFAYSPMAMAGGDTWTYIDVDYRAGCGITDTGAAKCWGGDIYGRMGNGSGNSDNDTAAAITEAGPWKHITIGDYHACAVKTDDTGWCWGRDLYGNLGDGAANAGATVEDPTLVSGSYSWDQIHAGSGYSCGIQTDATLWCWGHQTYGALGLGTTNTDVDVPNQVGSDTWLSVAVSDDHTCGIKSDKTLWCWGRSAFGQLGLGPSASGNYTTPTQIIEDGPWEIVDVSGNQETTCAVKSDGTLWCWGRDTYNQLGNGADTTDQFSPVEISIP